MIFIIFTGHTYYGGIVEYLLDPSFMPAKIAPDATEADVQTFFLFLTLISLTGKHQPWLINDWSHLHQHLETTDKTKYQAVLRVLQSFQNDLKALSAAIDALNVKRVKMSTGNAFNSFNPRVMECSVSV